MKRFLRFDYYGYYPGGGMDDFVGDFDTLEEAQKSEVIGDFADILDHQTGQKYSYNKMTKEWSEQ